MIAFATFRPQPVGLYGDGWLHGLHAAAAAVVLQAVVQMARTLAVGPIRAGLAIGRGLGLFLVQGPAAQVADLAAGGLFGLALLRDDARRGRAGRRGGDRRPQSALIALGLFVLLLVGLPIAGHLLQNPGLGMASVFYRTGSLVFGGGHVVLPLLEREIVERRWLDPQAFLAGYGVVQAMPGPLFTFAGYVGAAQRYGPAGSPAG
jgi:chromate transporter